MRILKSQSFLRLMNSYFIDSPQPANLSYLWNFGSLLGLCLVLQILTGVFLAMHYTPHVDFAFNSVEHIMRDVNAGYILRYTHANVASFFFIFVYIHIARGLFYSSYREPRALVWSIGVIILILMMGTGFLGYIHSPKWSKLTKFNFKTKNLSNNNISYNNSFGYCCNKNIRLLKYYNFQFPFTSHRFYSSANNPLHCSTNLNLKMNIPIPVLLNRKTNEVGGENIINEEREKGQMSKILVRFIKDHTLKPVFYYENLHLKEKKEKILQETKGLSGIYLILNKITLDFYVGSASTNRFYARFTNHLYYFRGSKIVKLAVNKYKLSNFAFLILELFPEIVTKENNKNLLDLEDFYLKTLLPNYNILTEAGSSFGYKHTELDRLKLKSNYSIERKLILGNLNRGKIIKPETIEKIREKALTRDRTKIIISEQSLINMKKKSKSIILYNLDYTIFGEYDNITEAAASINCSYKTIYRALKTEKKLLKRRFIVKKFF